MTGSGHDKRRRRKVVLRCAAADGGGDFDDVRVGGFLDELTAYDLDCLDCETRLCVLLFNCVERGCRRAVERRTKLVNLDDAGLEADKTNNLNAVIFEAGVTLIRVRSSRELQ